MVYGTLEQGDVELLSVRSADASIESTTRSSQGAPQREQSSSVPMTTSKAIKGTGVFIPEAFRFPRPQVQSVPSLLSKTTTADDLLLIHSTTQLQETKLPCDGVLPEALQDASRRSMDRGARSSTSGRWYPAPDIEPELDMDVHDAPPHAKSSPGSLASGADSTDDRRPMALAPLGSRSGAALDDAVRFRKVRASDSVLQDTQVNSHHLAQLHDLT